MGYQVPKADHPWRRYKDRFDDKGDELEKLKQKEKKVKPVKKFLSEIVESWESVEVVTNVYGREGRFNLTELPQEKIAAWIAGMLKRNYGK